MKDVWVLFKQDEFYCVCSDAKAAVACLMDELNSSINAYNRWDREDARAKKRQFEGYVEEVAKSYNEDADDFGCDYCWAHRTTVYTAEN